MDWTKMMVPHKKVVVWYHGVYHTEHGTYGAKERMLERQCTYRILQNIRFFGGFFSLAWGEPYV